VLQTLGIDDQVLCRARSDRIVKANTLDEATVAAVALVGGNNVVEGALLGATTGKANDDHVGVLIGLCENAQ
jgi:hypothetical protein